MAKRTVKIGVATYRRADVTDAVQHGFGLMGQEVDVHDDDLERFDALNVAPEPLLVVPVAAETGEVPVVEPAPIVADAADLDAMTLAELKDYATERGVDLDGATRKDDIRAAIDAASN